jgi:hypothetical protein
MSDQRRHRRVIRLRHRDLRLSPPGFSLATNGR